MYYIIDKERNITKYKINNFQIPVGTTFGNGYNSYLSVVAIVQFSMQY